MTAPAPAAICANIFGARRIRVTMVDGCGRPIFGPQSQAVSKAFTQVELGNEVEAGDEISMKNAAGEQCFPAFKNPDSIKWHTIKITFCNIDPAILLLIHRTWKRVTDAKRQTTTGWRGSLNLSDTVGFALELWPKVGAGASAICTTGDIPDPDLEVNGYMLFPWIISQAPDNWTLENAPATLPVNGISKVGSLWEKGPYNVTRDADGQPSRLLDPIDPGFNVPSWTPPFVTSGDPDPYHFEYVTVKPPEPSCGALPLWNPAATPPVITVAADGANTRRPVLTITNFDQTGRSGTVHWGDGTSDSAPPASNGVVKKAADYAPALDGQQQTITYYAGTGAAPVTTTFTPQAPAVAQGDDEAGPDVEDPGFAAGPGGPEVEGEGRPGRRGGK